jgi:hypothetical protein
VVSGDGGSGWERKPRGWRMGYYNQLMNSSNLLMKTSTLTTESVSQRKEHEVYYAKIIKETKRL